MQVVKISLIGFLIIGLFGFIVDMLWLGVLKNLFK